MRGKRLEVVGDKPLSAGDHEWREILVRIRPDGPRLTYALHFRTHRGRDLVSDLRWGGATAHTSDRSAATVAGALRAVAYAAYELAARLDRGDA